MSAPRQRNIPRELDELRHLILTLQAQMTSERGGIVAAPHAPEHSSGSDDEVDVTELGGFPGGSPVTYLDSDGNFTDPGSGSGITQLTGDVTAGPGTGSQAATIPNGTVTYAKMQDVSATSRILGRKSASSGDVEECTLSEILDFIGSAAQGDVLYRGAATWARLGAGTNGYFLQTQGTGANPQWALAAGGGAGTASEVLISEQTPSGTGTVTFSSISGSYRDLRVVVRGRSSDAAIAVNVTLRFNSDSSALYDRQLLHGNTTNTNASSTINQTSLVVANIAAGGAVANYAGLMNCLIGDYRGTTFFKRTISHSGYSTSNVLGNQNVDAWSGQWRSTTAITQIDVILSAGNFDSGSVVSLYGVL